jgi:protein tyrosine/serine phosphatase
VIARRFACWLLLLGLGCSRPSQGRPAEPRGAPAASSSARPAIWAQKVEAGPNLPNLHRVTPSLYRGAQPEDEGFGELKALGIKTVVNLRSMHSDRSETEAHGLGYVHLAEQAWAAEDEETLAFLKVALDPERQPIFVHCQHGADRTGTSVAAYRIVVQGWSKRDAIREMTNGGFGYHSIWTNLIRYVENLDVEKMRRELGIQAPPAAR